VLAWLKAAAIACVCRSADCTRGSARRGSAPLLSFTHGGSNAVGAGGARAAAGAARLVVKQQHAALHVLLILLAPGLLQRRVLLSVQDALLRPGRARQAAARRAAPERGGPDQRPEPF
jgi:hypothetical protein